MTAKRKTGKAAASKAVAELVGQIAAAVANLPAVMEESEPRAFPIMNEVPSGHALFRVADDRHEPHLHGGEWIVVDTTDRGIVFGEVYLVLQSSGPILWQVSPHINGKCGYIRGGPCAWLRPLNKPRWLPNGDLDFSGPVHMSDGPIYVRYLEKELLGRVVGLFIGPRAFADRIREAAERERDKEEARKRRAPPQIEGGRP